MPILKTTTTRPSSYVSFAPQTTFAVQTHPDSMSVADVNGDGNADVVTANPWNDNISVLLGDGRDGLAAQTTFAVRTYPMSMSVADVNGDGNADVVTANYFSDNVSLLLGDGRGGFAKQTTFAVGTYPMSVSVADMNGDGNADVVTANEGSHNVSVLLGDGRGGFAKQTTFVVGYSPESVNVADVNGDGNADVVTANYGSNDVSVLLGDGRGSFAAQTTFAVGHVPNSVSVADMNGDGNADVVTANWASDNVSLLLGDGRGGFAAQTTFAVGDLPNSVSVADMNGDGNVDVVTANGYSNNVSVLLGDGRGGLAAQTTFAVGTEPRSVSVADVNGDGNADLVTANYGSNDVSMLLNANANNKSKGNLIIEGVLKQNKTLTVSNALTDKDGLGDLSYQWLRDGAEINGATDKSYKLTGADTDKKMGVRAEYIDGEGNEKIVISTTVDSVISTNNLPTGTVVIVGNTKEGESLKIKNTLADVDGLGVMSHQWLRGNEIVGVNDAYVLSAADIGKKISLKASYLDGGGTAETVTSSATAIVTEKSATAGNDLLIGTNGNDKISGLAGNDTLIGGLGVDALTGGKGADIFKFNNIAETGITSKTRDVITDFNPKEKDKIDLSAIETKMTQMGYSSFQLIDIYSVHATYSREPFVFIGNKAFDKTDATGQLRFDATSHILYGSTNADSKPEFSIQLNGVNSLVATDFVL